jgi:hypothetical protein
MKIAAGPELSDIIAPIMSIKRPKDSGITDPLVDVRLRIGIIDNPSITRSQDEIIDPLNPYKIINMSTGKICVKWLTGGGLIRSEDFLEKKEEELEEGEKYDDFSHREIVTLIHPVMWSNHKNWMGFHYMPPVGSVVVIGFRKNNLPILLGFLPSHYQICDELNLGEMMLKGYGNNTSHWKQNNEIEHKVWSTQGEKDALGVTFNETIRLKIRMKSSNNNKEEVDNNEDVSDLNNKNNLIEIIAYNSQNDQNQNVSLIEVMPGSISLCSYQYDQAPKSKIVIGPDSIQISSPSVKINDKEVNL